MGGLGLVFRARVLGVVRFWVMVRVGARVRVGVGIVRR